MAFSPQNFITHSLEKSEWGFKAAKIISDSINSVDPAAAISKYVSRRGEICNVALEEYNVKGFNNIYVVGAGKAGAPMSISMSNILGEYMTEGYVIIKDGYRGEAIESDHPGISLLEAGHPLPDERGVRGTEMIINLLQSAGENDLVFCLISGGGSALLTAPVEDVGLENLQELMNLMLASGASISEINAVRKHLDAIKGGRLAQLASPAKVISLILSDVLGDPIDVIASGPTVPDTSTFDDALRVLNRYEIMDKVANQIITYLEKGSKGEIEETPKPGDILFEHNQTIIIGSNKTAAKSAIQAAKSEGFNTLLLTTYLQGEARYAGEFLASIARQLRTESSPLDLPSCIVVGGETTVKIKGEGTGGRNQELALGAAAGMSGLANTILIALATDGEDGPTDAAGAVVTGETLNRARNLQMDNLDYLSHNDSYHYFSKLGDLMKPGPTRTNVNDLTFIFSY